MKYLINILVLAFIVGCGSHLDEELPTIPGSVPSGDSGGSGAPGATTPQKRFSTSNGGSFSITTTQSVSLDSGETLKGMASDASNIYLLTKIYVSYNTQQWIIYKLPLGRTDAQIQCNLLMGYSDLQGGLAWDGTYFYIAIDYSKGRFAKFGTNCSQYSDFNTGIQSGYQTNPTFDYDGGHFYWTRTSSYYPAAQSALLKVSAGSGTLVSSMGVQAIGTKTTNWDSYSKAIAARNGTKWAVFSSSYSEITVWKLSDFSAMGVGSIPSKDLDYAIAEYITAPNSSTLVLADQNYDGLELFFFDVAGF